MQLANLKVRPIWYFLFGCPEKSSLAKQYASEHNFQHLCASNLEASYLKDKIEYNLVIECSASLFREVEPIKPNIQVVILGDQLSQEVCEIKKDYQRIGRCICLCKPDYCRFRKALYPKLVVIYSPCPIQKRFLADNYFIFTGYQLINRKLSANDIVSKLPKSQNYILFNFVPESSQLLVLQTYFNVTIIHLKHQRSELANQEEFFNCQSKIVPTICNKPYYNMIQSDPADFQFAQKIGEVLLPELIYVKCTTQEQKAGVVDHVAKTNGLLLNFDQIINIMKKKNLTIPIRIQQLNVLVSIIFKCRGRKQLFITNFPSKPQQFFMLRDKTRGISLFADCCKPQNYQPSMDLTPTIYFLQAQKRKQIQPDFSFQQQIVSTNKYLIVSGPPCVGKTSASKYIASCYGYKHIEYQSYIASVKEKLIAPEDGQDLPFAKIIKHFNSLICNSGDNPILIDGINFDCKQIDNWVQCNGPPIIINLKTDAKELIKRNRKKNQGDLAAQITEEDTNKAKEGIDKNVEWTDQFTSRCPNTTVYQVDFSPQLLLAQKLLDQILKPRVFLVQWNPTTLLQNVAVRYNLGFFDLFKDSISTIAAIIRKGQFRNVILNNYNQAQNQLVCKDFHQIQKSIGLIRYLAVWNGQNVDCKDQQMELEAPPKVEKPKPAEGQEAEPEPPQEEEGQAKKKEINIFDYKWTKPGSCKNMSQWYCKMKKCVTKKENDPFSLYKEFEQTMKCLDNKEINIYQSIKVGGPEKQKSQS